jgi:hypothetical protein
MLALEIEFHSQENHQQRDKWSDDENIILNFVKKLMKNK